MASTTLTWIRHPITVKKRILYSEKSQKRLLLVLFPSLFLNLRTSPAFFSPSASPGKCKPVPLSTHQLPSSPILQGSTHHCGERAAHGRPKPAPRGTQVGSCKHQAGNSTEMPCVTPTVSSASRSLCLVLPQHPTPRGQCHEACARGTKTRLLHSTGLVSGLQTLIPLRNLREKSILM